MFLSVFESLQRSVSGVCCHTMGPMVAARHSSTRSQAMSWPRPGGGESHRSVGKPARLTGFYRGRSAPTAPSCSAWMARPPASLSTPTGGCAAAEISKAARPVAPPGHPEIPGSTCKADLVFDPHEARWPGHANGMAFSGLRRPPTGCLLRRIYLFRGRRLRLVSEDELQKAGRRRVPKGPEPRVPFPFRNAGEWWRCRAERQVH